MNTPASRPIDLPLGIRQRLSLAVAVVHEPKLLILDEPTSGVDPVARDQFWELLVELSRQHGVTIFISTHFMNEAERCDRISLMHAGKVLASDTPAGLCAARGEPTLEAAFIGYLEEATGVSKAAAQAVAQPAPLPGRACCARPARPLPEAVAGKRGEPALQPAPPARLRLPRSAGTAPRPDPPCLRAARFGAAHVRARFRHFDGCRRPAFRRARPRPVAGEPGLCAEYCRFALLHRAAAHRRYEPSSTGA